MKKYFVLILLLTFAYPLYSKKILIIQTENLNNYKINSYYFDLTEIDFPLFQNFICKNFIFEKKYNPDAIINYLLSKSIKLKSSTFFKNYKIVDDNILITSKIIIDSKYKILEKDGKKYYIFNVCYPEEEKKSFIKKLFQWLM